MPKLDDRPPIPFIAGSIHGLCIYGARSPYIGNAPNFNGQSHCRTTRRADASFFGYMVWSVIVLVPLFALHTMIFFRLAALLNLEAV